MKITVTKAHVESATARDSHHCMIADAIKDEVGGKYILVDLQSIRWSDMESGERYTYLTPPACQQAIIKFDQGKPVKPFGFSLTKPVMVRPVTHVRSAGSDPEALKRARRKYENKRKAKRDDKRREMRSHIPTRERQYGVRMLEG